MPLFFHVSFCRGAVSVHIGTRMGTNPEASGAPSRDAVCIYVLLMLCLSYIFFWAAVFRNTAAYQGKTAQSTPRGMPGNHIILFCHVNVS